MSNFLERIIGEIEAKKEWRATQQRTKALPEEYRVVYDEIQRYILEGGAGIVGTVKPFKRLVEVFEEGAATGKHVLQITSDDVAAFANKLVQDEEPQAQENDWREKLNRKLNNNIARKLGK